MKILCLHGSGTNIKIFQMQTAAIRYELEKDGISFEFVQGGLRCRPAEEISSLLPKFTEFFAYYDPRDAKSILAAENELMETLIERKSEFDGVLAFSEGAALAAALIARYARENPFELESLFRFGVFACGLNPFDHQSLVEISRTENSSRLPPKRVAPETAQLTGSYLVNIPTYHILATNDMYFEYGMALYRCCDPQQAIKTVHNGGHSVPSHPVKLVKEVTQNIRAVIARVEFLC